MFTLFLTLNGSIMLTAKDRQSICTYLKLSERKLCKLLGKSKSYLRYYNHPYAVQPTEVFDILYKLLKEKNNA